jgi:hypothetical protein
MCGGARACLAACHHFNVVALNLHGRGSRRGCIQWNLRVLLGCRQGVKGSASKKLRRQLPGSSQGQAAPHMQIGSWRHQLRCPSRFCTCSLPVLLQRPWQPAATAQWSRAGAAGPLLPERRAALHFLHSTLLASAPELQDGQDNPSREAMQVDRDPTPQPPAPILAAAGPWHPPWLLRVRVRQRSGCGYHRPH